MASKEVKPNFILVMDWMVEELKLTGNHAMIYAIIYGYSKHGGWFQGSTSYLCKRTGLSEKGVRKILQSLCDDGHLKRRDRPYKGIKYVDYQAIPPEQSTEGNKVPQGTVQSTEGVRYKVPTKINNNKDKIKYTRAREYLDFPQRDLDYDEIERKLISIHLDDIETR